MAPPCDFLDKLAPELRVSIYKHIFGDSEVIKMRDSTASLGIDNYQISLNDLITVTHVPLETSILATNKLIHREATEILYHNRIIRATIPEFGELLHEKEFVNNAEKVEIADCKNGFARFDSNTVLKHLQNLPRMLSVVILSDCLYSIGRPDGDRAWSPSYADIVSVSDFAENIAQLGHVTCVDIGRYELHGNWSRVQIVNRKLSKMWPSARDTPEDYDVWEDLDTIWNRWQPPVTLSDQLALTLQTSFRCWVGLHEELVAMNSSGKINELLVQARAGTLSELDSTRLQLMTMFVVSNHRRDEPDLETRHLRHLKPGDDYEKLAWATEYLAKRTAVFGSLEGSVAGLNTRIRASHWAEADGGLHSIECIIKQQRLAIEGIPTSRYILDPVRRKQLIDCDTVRRVIDAYSFDRLAKPELLSALSPLEFRQLAYLCIATVAGSHRFSLPGGVVHGRELDEWASDLLKRHLLVSDWADPKDVQNMSLRDMSDCLIALLRRPDLKEIRTEPPEGIDDDLFVPLAWKWSWEYSNACVEQLQAGHEIERSSEWEESGSEAGSGNDVEEEEEEEE